MSSIFSKLAGTERHKEFIAKLELGEMSIDPGRKASSVAGMTAMGIGLKVTCACRETAAAIGGDALLALAGPDTPLKSIRFICRSCGGNALAMPENLDRLDGLPSAGDFFSHIVRRVAEPHAGKREVASSPDGSGENPPVASELPMTTGAAETPAKKKRGRPRKAAATAPDIIPKETQGKKAPAKRGRKPKGVVTGEDKPARKRGRPPKQKEPAVRENKATSTRRGRPPKAGPAKSNPVKDSKPARKRGRPPKSAPGTENIPSAKLSDKSGKPHKTGPRKRT